MRKILTVSSKGGVGKTLVTINLAYAIKQMGYRAGIGDGDITMPALTRYLKIEDKAPEYTVDGVIPINVDGVEVMSTGLLMSREQPVVMNGKQRADLMQQFLDKVKWNVDYLFIDTPPGNNDELEYLIRKQRHDIYGVVVVTTPSDVAISQVRIAIKLFKTFNVRVLGIVGNMVSFEAECPHCHQHAIHPIFANGSTDPINELAEEFQVGVIARLPIYQNTDKDPLHFVPYIINGLRGIGVN